MNSSAGYCSAVSVLLPIILLKYATIINPVLHLIKRQYNNIASLRLDDHSQDRHLSFPNDASAYDHPIYHNNNGITYLYRQ